VAGGLGCLSAFGSGAGFITGNAGASEDRHVARVGADTFDGTEIAGMELAQAVQQGRPVSRRDLVERSLVKRGQFVDAVANEGRIEHPDACSGA